MQDQGAICNTLIDHLEGKNIYTILKPSQNFWLDARAFYGYTVQRYRFAEIMEKAIEAQHHYKGGIWI